MTNYNAVGFALSLFTLISFSPAAEVITMAEFVVVDRNDDPAGIIPKRFTSTLFGSEDHLAEIPRSVTLIEEEALTRYGIRSVHDFIALTPGTHTSNFFGIPGSLEIRGSTSDTFFRGFRRVENRGNYPTPIGASERVEVVRGPPTPLYGGGKVGGFMNFFPKTARSEAAKYIERSTGSIDLTYGTYEKKGAEVEYGAPFELGRSQGGFYAYAQAEDSDSFYKGITERSHLLQLAVDLTVSPRLRLEIGGMLQRSELPQNPGWNRATQALIDDGTYITGTASSQVPHPVVDSNGNGFIDESEALRDLNGPPFGFGPPDGIPDPVLAQIVLGIRPTPPNPDFALRDAGTARISPQTVFIDPADFADSDTLTLYFDAISDVSPDLQIKNQLFYDQLKHQKYSSYGYTADYDPFVWEDKLALRHAWEPEKAAVRAENTVGASYRYYETTTREAFAGGMQIPDRRDLTVGPTPRDRFASAFTPGRNWTRQYDSSIQDLGFFLLSDVAAFDAWKVSLGGRYDRYQVEVDDLQTAQSASESENVFTCSASLTYALLKSPSWQILPYLTYGQSTYLELDQAGGVEGGVAALLNDRWLADSDLWEGGVKLLGLNGRLFVAFDVYQQNRTRVDVLSSSTVNTRATGYELELRYAPNRHWSFSAAGTWQKTLETVPADGIGISTIVPPSLLGQNPAQAYGGIYFTGSTLALGRRTLEAEGQPDKILSLYLNYNGSTDSAFPWGITTGTTYVAGVHSGRLQALKLPDYWLSNLHGFVRFGDWRAAISVKNALDETYFRTQAIATDTTVLPGAGMTAELTLGYTW